MAEQECIVDEGGRDLCPEKHHYLVFTALISLLFARSVSKRTPSSAKKKKKSRKEGREEQTNQCDRDAKHRDDVVKHGKVGVEGVRVEEHADCILNDVGERKAMEEFHQRGVEKEHFFPGKLRLADSKVIVLDEQNKTENRSDGVERRDDSVFVF